MTRLNLSSLQFRDDWCLREALLREPLIAETMAHADAMWWRSRRRTRYLGDAVRIDSSIAPSLAETVSELVEMVLGVDTVEAVEVYVEEDSTVNARVEPSGNGRNSLVVLTSGAVNGLDLDELRFLLGHELGHVLFDHLDVPSPGAFDSLAGIGLPPQTCMQLRAWDRAAEISADRIGLVCCGSLDHAAGALFKVLSGVTAAEFAVQPERLGDQWQALHEEVAAVGARDQWEMTHPFPPLRMKAITLFSESCEQELGLLRQSGKAVDSEAVRAVDREISRLSALMNPDGRAEPLSDPQREEFLLWGGLYVALADGDVGPAEVGRIQTVAPEGVDVRQIVSDLDGADARCVLRFRETVFRRRTKLRTVEKYAIVSGLIDVASADGRVDPAELERLQELGGYIGVSSAGCELIARQYREEGKHVG